MLLDSRAAMAAYYESQTTRFVFSIMTHSKNNLICTPQMSEQEKIGRPPHKAREANTRLEIGIVNWDQSRVSA